MFYFEFNVISYVVLVYNRFVLFVYHVFVCFTWTPGRIAAACVVANGDPNKLNLPGYQDSTLLCLVLDVLVYFFPCQRCMI